jgi:probable phosphoglycerate mutase
MRSGNFVIPQGEDNQALHNRAVSAFDELAMRHSGQMVAIVSHGVFIKSTLLHVLGLPVGRYERLDLRGNTSISIVEIRNGQSCLSRLNDTAHLENF